MNENINLCKILKGHEGETFYSPIFGNLTFICVIYPDVRFKTTTNIVWDIKPNGKLYNNSDELCVFPSKDQRDWNKWIKEQKHKVPKTWSEYVSTFDIESEPTLWFDSDMNFGAIGNSCSALFKIHQLIEVGYGGNVTNEEWKDTTTTKFTIVLYYTIMSGFEFAIHSTTCVHNMAFHTREQAEKFLKYPENVQLLKDYSMM